MINYEEIEEMIKEIKKKEKEGGTLTSLEDLLSTDRKPKAKDSDAEDSLMRGKRTGGRDMQRHRPLFVQLGTVSNARGSCYIEVGDTKVVVSVRGPIEIPNIKEYTEMCEIECLVEYAPFSSTHADEGYLCQALRQSLEPVLCRHEFPNLRITVSAFILEDGGSVLSAAITGASLALTHARLPCFGIVTSVTAAVFRDKIVVDPDFQEESLCLKKISENDSSSVVTVAFMPDLEQITFFEQIGSCEVFEPVTAVLVAKCQELHRICSQHALKEAKSSVKTQAATADTTSALNSLKVS